MKNSANIIERIEQFAASRKWKKGRLAREAGLQATTLRHFGHPKWNPTIETLRRIEAIIPDDFQPEPAAVQP